MSLRVQEVAVESADLRGFNPRTVATGSVYVAALIMSSKTFTQREVGETLGMAEYTVREFICRMRRETMATQQSTVWLVKSGPGLRRT